MTALTEPVILLNPFVNRQTPASPFSHFEGDGGELLSLVRDNFHRAVPGYKDGVLEVPVPPDRFRSAVTPLREGQTLTATFAARREGEAPFLTVNVVAPKAQAKEVKIILYSHAILGGDAATEADYEVISINASILEGGEPMHAVAMARNFLGLAGGTKAEYTAEQFAKAVLFWASHAMATGDS
jgi:hypothetical protein